MNSSSLCVDADLVLRLVAVPADEAVRSTWEGWSSETRQLAAPTLLRHDVAGALPGLDSDGYAGDELDGRNSMFESAA